MHYIEWTPREQLVMFNSYLDEIISKDNPVRFIDAYVDSLDLLNPGIKIPEMRTGKPPYAPADLLKMYICSYF